MDTIKLKEYARSLGADLVGIADAARFDACPPSRDPRAVLPTARAVIGAAFRVPRGLYAALDTQPYAYTALGVKAIDEEIATVFLLKMARYIENAGYEACVQRTSPNLIFQDGPAVNPEVSASAPLRFAMSVDGVRPAPEVTLDFPRAAALCGLGTLGLRGSLLTRAFGPLQRTCFIITNAPFDPDPMETEPLCDRCGACAAACPGRAIDPETGVSDWQCAVYYRGAGAGNPYQPEDFLRDDPAREAILSGEKRFDEAAARAIFPKLNFLPPTHYGYVPCLCGKRCDAACLAHLRERGLVK